MSYFPFGRYTVEEDMEIIQFISRNNLHGRVLGIKMYKWAAVSFSKRKMISLNLLFQREGVAQGKVRRSYVALRSQFILKILNNLASYQLPIEELEKYRMALTIRRENEKLKPGSRRSGKGLRIAIVQILEAIKKAEK